VSEAQNEAGDFFGEERLYRILPRLSKLSVEQIGECIVNEVDHFVGNAAVSDDISIVILRKT